jgi:hypothetical protein
VSVYRHGTMRGLRRLDDRIETDRDYICIPNALVIVDGMELICATENMQYLPQAYAKPWAYARYLNPTDATLSIDPPGSGVARIEKTCFCLFTSPEGIGTTA